MQGATRRPFRIARAGSRRPAVVVVTAALVAGLVGCADSGATVAARESTDPERVSAPVDDLPSTASSAPPVIDWEADPDAVIAPEGAVAHYPLEVDFASTVAGAPPLELLGDVAIVSDADSGGAGAAEFAITGGLRLPVAGLVDDPEVYTIAFRFYLDPTRGQGLWSKVIDLHDRKLDEGLYVIDGAKYLFYGHGDSAGLAPLPGPPYASVALRRDADGTLSWFSNGRFARDVDDSEDRLGVIEDALLFFVDDLHADSGPEHNSGRVAWITVFGEALSDEAMTALTR